MDGQLGVSGENYSMPHLMDQFLELGSLGSVIDHSETKSEGPLKVWNSLYQYFAFKSLVCNSINVVSTVDMLYQSWRNDVSSN
jgi:hypothetical protein